MPSLSKLDRALSIAFVMVLSSCFHDKNHPPTAQAGPDVVTSIGSTINLDGSASSDVDGDKLRFEWSIIDKPQSSLSELSALDTATPSLTIDTDGRWQIELIVSDGKRRSKPDQISILSKNTPPVAIIDNLTPKTSESTIVGDTIVLDASQSSDPENRSITYQWGLIVKPDESESSLSAFNTAQVDFVVDRPGEYIVHLVVNDGVQLSEPEAIIIRAEAPVRLTDTVPIAEAGPDQILTSTGVQVQLDATGSFDQENDPLSYQWEMLAKPADSQAVLSGVSSSNALFIADKLGSYVAKLVVFDRNGASHNDIVVVTTHDTAGLFCQDCHNGTIARGKSPQHLLNHDDCGACHQTTQWVPTKNQFHPHGHNAWPPACDVCHDSQTATGKPADHIITQDDCNHCHLISETTWLPALAEPGNVFFEHTGIVSGCIDCHNALENRGKPDGHIPSSDRCNACHAVANWLPALHVEHSAALGECTDCHDAGITFP